MEAGRESSKAKRARAAMSNEDDTTSQGSAGGGAAASAGAVTAVAAETEGDEMAVVAAAEQEQEQMVSAETEEHIQRILLAIDNYTRQVSDMLDAGRALFKDLAADFEDRLCSIHKEKVERWEEEIRELRASDAANEQARALLHNAQLHLLHTVRD
ncbi:hypothetical protein BDA96_01G574300 [Sorghum bicolor]|uniref:Uncharacterized protein n=2 Tax=Sorghum bicolor TaxID=4558 RepID=C5WMQ0_SORBI|nr:uncharacterized protein LOC8078025 [Sorghum bicolor]EER93009.1 hypothetical protein SORBI_3001G537600 [Sorghum bicolor]KAG0553200.1 hypothetical protein BDA96_01G574300 [Sorghum bicolor]OQU93428.1 hypothetical protein SORBI_3001G537600 [Sorghum bicolor]|eukprot:XP_002466011.1 uncharacterized protein LOC8078025 [Sorghum bicolor]